MGARILLLEFAVTEGLRAKQSRVGGDLKGYLRSAYLTGDGTLLGQLAGPLYMADE